MEEVKKRNCMPWLLLGLLLFGLLALLSNCVGASNYKIMADKAKTTAQDGLTKAGFANATAKLEGANVAIEGNAETQDAKLATCEAAKTALEAKRMVGLPGVVRDVICKVKAPGDDANGASGFNMGAGYGGSSNNIPSPKLSAAAQACQTELLNTAKTGKVTFVKGSPNIQNGKPLLNDIAKVAIKCSDFKIEVAGHTDTGGDAAMNLSLSQLRADAVRSYLIGKGARPEQIIARGYGETKPLVDDHAVVGVDNPDREKNRRIEFSILAQ